MKHTPLCLTMKYPTNIPHRLSPLSSLPVETGYSAGTTWDDLDEPNLKLVLEDYRSMSRSDNGYCPKRARENKIITEKLTVILNAISKKFTAKSVDGHESPEP
jgi:hypothetical protein